MAVELDRYRSNTFAESTKATYRSHRNKYLAFCQQFGCKPLPASTSQLTFYVAYLARSLKPQCIPQYLNYISLIHQECGLPNPISRNWVISSTLTGIKRTLGCVINRKLPITPELLLSIYKHLSLRSSFHTTFWAVCLTSFFGFFRKSHILPTSRASFNPNQQFLKSDFSFYQWGVLITVRWSKTLQFQERVVQVPIFYIRSSPLCPVSAIINMLHHSHRSNHIPSSPMFTWSPAPSSPSVPLTYGEFVSFLRSMLALIGLAPDDYASHSFRRGGASLALLAGVPIEQIKALGDWSSDAVFLYLHSPLSVRLQAQDSLSKFIHSQTQSHS